MHKIIAKSHASPTATTEYENSILVVDERVVSTIKQRLVDAAGKESRAFELEFSNTSPGSFYSICHNIKDLNSDDFISRSQEMSELLASAQTRTYMPGGYFILIESEDPSTRLAMYIVIKAELHEALKYESENDQSRIQFLDKIFLSPSQKLFKLGILHEKSIDYNLEGNAKYGCFLFDDQFRSDGNPAEYFYKEFLGFTIYKNSKIQSKLFYDSTKAFIISNVTEYELKNDLLSALRLTFTTSTDSLITPSNFCSQYFQNQDLKEKYTREVVRSLPASFVKDRILLDRALTTRKLDFPEKINVVGPEISFDDKVQIINTPESFMQLDSASHEYTILKIKGKPFNNE